MGKFEKHNRPAYSSQSYPGAYSAGKNSRLNPRTKYGDFGPTKKGGKKPNRGLLALILGILVIGVGVVAGLLCVRFFGKGNDPTANLIREDVYIAGVNVGGLDKQAALDLLMQTYPPVNPPATNADGQQEPVLARIYTDRNMNIRLYASPAELTLFQTTYDTSVSEIPVDIYGKPMEQDSVATSETTEATTEPTEETTVSTTTRPEEDAPVTEDGTPYVLDKTIVLPASQVNMTLDLTAAVERAFAIGKEADTVPAEGPVAVSLNDFLTMDSAYIRDVLDSTYEDTFMEGSETLVEKSKTTIVKTEGEESKEVEVDCLVITFGTKGRELDTAALYDEILASYSAEIFDLQVLYKETLPTVLDLDELYRSNNCKAPVNAVCDEKTFAITPETMGYGFLMSDAIALAEGAKPGDQITLTLVDLEPQHTKAEMEKLLFNDILGSCVSPHVYNPTRTRNLELAAKAINGTILLPGEEFSFNRIVGERTAEKGYGEAGVYVGGRTENQLGGGVCQVASAIYYSCLKADLKITERYEHQYTPTYVPWGMDATIYWGALDYRFINNTAYPIRVDASVHDGAVYIDLVGTETRNYTVKLDYSIIDEDKSEEKTIYIHPSMKDYSKFKDYKNGETIQTAYDGYKVKTYMYKYDLNGNYIETIWVNTSNYDRRDKEIAYILDPNKPMQEQIDAIENPTEPTEPPATEPPATEPPATEPPATEPPTEVPTEPPTEAPTDPPTESTETPSE